MRHAILLLLLLTAPALAGCTGALDEAETPEFTAEGHTMAPGTTVAVSFVFENATTNATNLGFTVVDDGGLTVEAPRAVVEGEGGALAAFVNVTAPRDAEAGERVVRLHVLGLTAGGEPLLAHVPVTVEAPEEALAEGDVARVEFTARLPDGTVVWTTRPAVANGSLPKHPAFRAPSPGAPSARNVTLTEEGAPVPGLVRGLVGLGVGHSATFQVPPHLAFGNATTLREEPRESTLERVVEAQRVFAGERAMFGPFLNASSREGDRVTVDDSGDLPAYRVTRLNDTHAELTMDVSVGERYTHYGVWPNSSEVTNVTDGQVVFRVTPTTGDDEAFTWVPHWPNATTVAEVTDAEIVLRHTPEEGLAYTRQDRSGQPLPERVVAVGADAITVETANTSPLAGETIVFDVTVLSRG